MNSYKRRSGAKHIFYMVLMLPLLIAVHFSLIQTAGAQVTEPDSESFDHTKTGFNLTGAHASARCGSCHVQGVFKGTPRDCVVCHMVGNRMGAMSKPGSHVSTAAPCDSCHRTSAWTPAMFSHVGVAPGTCATCHNNTTATGKPNGHITTSASCDSCHRSTAWTPAGFNHAGVTPGTCTTCHGVTAEGKPTTGHVITTASCDSCHRTTAWTPASFNHTGIAPGTCATCHSKPNPHVSTNSSCDVCHRTMAWTPAAVPHTPDFAPPGSCATCHSKPTPHPSTNSSCDACHRTTAWTPATFSHTGVAPGTCKTCHVLPPPPHVNTNSSCDACHRTTAWTPVTHPPNITPGSCATCHNGTTATGKSSGHFVTTLSCDACHNTTGWTPLKTYSHTSTAYKLHSSSVTCVSCHKGNNEVITWTFATYKPDCAGCHAGNFKADSHKKVDSPTILYTVAELKNCAGSCHRYTNNTFTTISETRSGEHRSTDGGF